MDYKAYFKKYKKSKVEIADKGLEKAIIAKQRFENRIPSVKAQIISDMPIVHNDEDHSPVERFLIKSEEIEEELIIKTDMLQAEIDVLTAEVQAVDFRLEYLTNEERFIIIQHFVEELSWGVISNLHQEKYQKEVALQPQSLIDIRNRAINKLDELNNNKNTTKQQFTRV